MEKIPETQVSYRMIIDIPFNENTSKGWNEDHFLNDTFIRMTINHVISSLNACGQISLGRIFRMFGMREQPEQPNIFFQEIDADDIFVEEEDGTFYITMDLYGYFDQLLPVKKKNRRKIFKPYLVHPEEESRKLAEDGIVTERDKNGKPIAGRFPFGSKEDSVTHMDGGDDECQTGQKETSDSEENGKT